MKDQLRCDDIKYITVMGDFNICSNGSWEESLSKDQRLYTILSSKLSEQCNLNHDIFGQENRSFRYELKERPNAMYDHMFVTNALKTVNTNALIKDWKERDTVVSDHFGLLAEFNLPTNTNALIKDEKERDT